MIREDLVQNVGLRLNQTKPSSSKTKLSNLKLKHAILHRFCNSLIHGMTFSWMYLYLHSIDPETGNRCR